MLHSWQNRMKSLKLVDNIRKHHNSEVNADDVMIMTPENEERLQKFSEKFTLVSQFADEITGTKE